MPTLIRFAIVLLVLAALVFGAMVMLAIFVNPTQKEIRVRIPSSQIGVEQNNVDPLGLRAPAPTATAADTQVPPPEPVLSEPDADGTRTLELPAE